MSVSGKRVLVTGGAGFVGSFLVEKLKALDPAGITVPRSREYDLTNQQATADLFAEAKPEVVIHLAARVGGIGANQANPGYYFFANMAMGLNVVEEARRVEVEKLVFVGTTCSYPKFTPVPFEEDELWNGYPEETNAPYGVAKRSLLVMLQAYRQQYGLQGIYLLPANLYGPRDNFDLETSHVIPAMIRKFVEAQEAGASSVTLWGTGKVSREFLYVEDCAEGVLLATERYSKADPVNLGTSEEITIAELAEAVRSATGFEGEIVWDSTRPDGQPRRRLEVSRAKEEFGFDAGTSLDQGIKLTVEWFRGERSR